MKAVRAHRPDDRITPEDRKPRFTHDEIGKALGVTGSRVQQMEKQALRKFKERWLELERRGWPGL